MHGDEGKAAQLLGRWIGWALRCRRVPFKKLAARGFSTSKNFT